MKEKLWTGESVWCLCGHHLEYHRTSQRLSSSLGEDELNLFTHCTFKAKRGMVEYWCECKGFSPYYKERKSI